MLARELPMLNHYLTNTLTYDPAKCINCGMCLAVCPHGVFVVNGKAVRLARAQACMECGACQLNCPTKAFAVESGVGCAEAMIRAALTGSKEVTCGSGPSAATCSSQPAGSGSRSSPFSWLDWLRHPEVGGQCSASGAEAGAAKKAEC